MCCDIIANRCSGGSAESVWQLATLASVLQPRFAQRAARWRAPQAALGVALAIPGHPAVGTGRDLGVRAPRADTICRFGVLAG
jgi:hypothetical protein